MKNPILAVGWDNNGEIDFAVNGAVTQLTLSEMNELRVMIVAGIVAMENMWLWQQAAQTPQE